MHLDTPNQHKYKEEWDFAVIKCNDCGQESSVFIYKSHLTADEQIKYIEENTDFILDSENGEFICQNCRLKGEQVYAVV